MDFSVWLDLAHPPDEVLELARWADARGAHGIWVADHYMPNTGDRTAPLGPMHECWSMLPALAVVTERCRIGPLVAPTSVHHPALLANRAATIDHLSGGRMVLGLGAGWQVNEHHAYGLDLEPPGRRVTRFDEAIQIVRSLLDTERTDFDGEVYRFTDAPAEPKPIQPQLPILVGTRGARMLRIVARHADEWNAWGVPDDAGAHLARLRAACEAAGVDPATKRVSAQALVVITADDRAKRAALDTPIGDRTIAGSTDEIADAIGRYAELGFDEFVVPEFTFGRSLDERRAGFERFFDDIVSGR